MNLQQKIIALVVIVLLQIGIGCSACKYGYDIGFAAAESKYQKADIKTLETVITKTEALVNDAEKASLAINKTISDRISADQKTTQEFRNVLSTTAHLRIACVFDNNVMRKLGEAADRADQAAASGFVSALPTRAAPN